MTVISTSDDIQTKWAVEAISKIEGPVYLRLARIATPVIYEENQKFEIGKGIQIGNGMDATIITTGVTVSEALKAQEMLKLSGINVRVIDIHTIKPIDKEFGMYRLGFPNREVEEGFVRFLLPFYANVNKVESPFEIQKFVREVRFGDYDSFFRRLQSFFADTTYEVIREQELHYENVLFIVFKLVGFYTQVEYHTSKGRIDLVLQTDKLIYVMEFKLDGTAEEALQQINDKHYALPFASDRRKLFKIGVNFSAETRNIEKWIVEE